MINISITYLRDLYQFLYYYVYKCLNLLRNSQAASCPDCNFSSEFSIRSSQAKAQQDHHQEARLPFGRHRKVFTIPG